MEELQSTEVLDREILEDARRKAQRTLRTADETVASKTKTWERKTERALTGIRARYAQRLEVSRGEIMARLPLDKRRSRLEKIESLLRGASISYLTELPRRKLLGILETELKQRAGELQIGEANLLNSPGSAEGTGVPAIAARGLSGEELQGLLKNAFPRDAWTIREDALHAVPGSFPAIMVETRRARITVSADAVVGTLLQDKRAELAAALLGEGALDA
jgi:vacuolar-type H+-ATPase subunit E/Vma4